MTDGAMKYDQWTIRMRAGFIASANPAELVGLIERQKTRWWIMAATALLRRNQLTAL
jgi:hypothetical protein